MTTGARIRQKLLVSQNLPQFQRILTEKPSMSLDHLEEAKEKLSPNNLEAGLPGRDEQNEAIHNFLYERLKIRQTTTDKKARVSSGLVADIKGRHLNKTIFVCGVPGTGKTATIHCVEHHLKKLLDKKPAPIHRFQSVYINGQHLSAPNKVYCEILYKLTGETCHAEKAQEKLDEIFNQQYEPEPEKSRRTSRRPSTVKRKLDPAAYKLIIIDELDVLYDERRQQVFYSLFDWPTSAESKVILIAIANAMDLPERFMRGRIASRLGWEKVVFEPYTSDCLAKILEARLGQKLMNKCFDKNAIIVATKRIGRTTGDARRILDTCRLAIDKAISSKVPKITAALIDQVGFQNLDQQRLEYIKSCPPLELAILKSILLEAGKVGEDNIEAMGVFRQLTTMLTRTKSPFLRNRIIAPGHYDELLNTLAAYSLIHLESDKPLFKRLMFIKDSGDAFRDLIRSQPLA